MGVLIAPDGIKPSMTVLDVRWKLGAAPSLPDYQAGHVPGAVYVDFEHAFSGSPGGGGRHPLPDPEVFQRAMRAAGVRADRTVVVYDYGDGLAAARAWWTLRWAGHPDVRVLDGGFAAWVAAGGEVTAGGPQADREGHAAETGGSAETGEGTEAREGAETGGSGEGEFVVRPGGMPVLDAAGAAELAGRGALFDARAPERFRGETEPIDPVAGHIPGARNLPYAQLVNADGTLRRGIDLPEGEIGAYCGSGITAAHTILALHAAGREDAALYVGSWSEWITDPSRPIAKGESAQGESEGES